MFDSAYKFKGEYANKVKILCQPIQEPLGGNFTIFKRYVDVLECAALIGFNMNQKVDPDSVESGNSIEIPINTILNESSKLQMIYKLIMINEDDRNLPVTDRLNNAFRNSLNAENENIFNSYVLGGVDYLYSVFKNCTTRDEAVISMSEIIDRIKNNIVIS